MRIEVREEPKLVSSWDPEGFDKARKQLEGRVFWRDSLYDVLREYQRNIGNDSAAMANLEKIKDEKKFCIMTGQQLGLMGGPVYTILKAITCLLVAREYDAIPIFWFATEDHDIDEIDHTYLLDSLGNLKKYFLDLPKEGHFVEELALDTLHHPMIRSFLDDIDQQGMTEELLSETSYSKMMIRFLIQLFKGTGLVFMEPHLLRPFAKSFFEREIKETKTISRLTQDVVPEGTNLFLKIEGKYRVKIRYLDGEYFVGKRRMAQKELLELIEKEPERFSTNVAARPLLQNLLLPTLANIMGPGEWEYIHKLQRYHEHYQVPMTWNIPRLSATFIPPKAKKMLESCRLKPWDLIPHHWKEVIPSVEKGVENLTTEWAKIGVEAFREEIPAEVMVRWIANYTRNLQGKVVKARLRRQGIPSYTLHYLRNLLHPHKKPQERVLNWWEFQRATKENIVQELLKQANWKTNGHLYCYL